MHFVTGGLQAGAKPVTNQLPYNLLYRGIESGILPASAAKGMGVLW